MRHSTRKLTQKSKSTKVLLGLILSLAAVLSLTLSVFSNPDKAFAAELSAELNAEPISVAEVIDEVVDEPITDEAPKNLAELQQASDAQLDYWAEHLKSYDGREFGVVTPARNQGQMNICWAYAAVGAVESNILRKGIDKDATKDNLDLDEVMAAYTRAFRDGKQDPLMLTTHDTASLNSWDVSGTSVEAFAAMTQGYTLNNDNNFNQYTSNETINNKLAQSKYFVDSYVGVGKNIEEIKRAIIKYGAVTVTYRASYSNYYYTDSNATNHASLIVGWDDTIESSKFSPRPTQNGAWIVKNSWGDYGNNKVNGVSCFYLSYDSYIKDLAAVDLEMKDKYQNLYYYDGHTGSSGKNFVAEKQAAIYEAKLSSSTRQEQLVAATIVAGSSDADFEVKVYKNLTVNPGNVNDPINIPEQGSPVASKSIHVDKAGYYTIDFDAPIDLEQGEYFSIVTAGQGKYNYAMVAYSDDSGESLNDMTYRCYNDVWVSNKNSSAYADSSTDNLSVKIRAVTNTVSRPNDLGNDLKYARVEVPDRLMFYTQNSELVPEISVYFDGKLLEKYRDYIVSANNDSPVKCTLKIQGVGAYSGTRTTTYEIAKAKYPNGYFTGVIEVYDDVTTLHQIPIPDGWEWGENDITLASGYSSYSYPINYVGQDKDFYQITKCSFHVNKISGTVTTKNISSAQVEVSGKYTYFNGNAIVPTVKVVLNGQTLNFGFDYGVSCENNTLAGEATVIITGKRFYQGQISKTFQIEKADWPKAVPPDVVYAGKNATSLRDVGLGADGWTWQNADLSLTADNFSATAIYTGTDKANFVNTEKQVTVKISGKKDISSVSLTLDKSNFVYDGQAKLPTVVAKDGTTTLTLHTDYEVEYRNNTNAGEASVVVTGKNEYLGSKTLTFTIERAERKDFSVTQKGWTYGDKDVPKPSISGEIETGTVTFTYSTDENGTFSSDVPTHAGSYWVKAEIAQSQNYNSATAKAQFVISPKDAERLNASLENDTFVYDTTAKTPEVVIKDGTVRLEAGVDYDVEYENNKFAGEGVAIVTFKNNYKGTKELNFTIEKAEKPNVDTKIECDKEATTLSDVALPEGFVWDDDSIEITGDKMTAKAVYVGEDASSYINTELTFEITVGSQSTPSTPGQNPGQTPGQDSPSTPGGTTPGKNPGENPGETSGESSGDPGDETPGDSGEQNENTPGGTPGDSGEQNENASGENDDNKNGCASCGTVTFGGTGGIGGGLGGGIAGGLTFLLVAALILIFPLKKRPER